MSKKKRRLMCGWCEKTIQPGEELTNKYASDAAYADRVPAMAYVHKEHVPLEDHP